MFKCVNKDCLDGMLEMDENSIDSIVTDPPYGLSFMGKDWDHGVPGTAFWKAAIRVAKPGAHLLAFGGTRTFHRLACAIEDAGWEIRDCVMWVYGSGFPKSRNLNGEWKGWGTALKPAWEPVIVARKPLDGTVAENVLRYGTGAMNIDGGRVGRGRWPANLIQDGSQQVLSLFPYRDGMAKRVLRRGATTGKGIGYMSNSKGGDTITGYDDTGSAARFFYCAKANRRDREEGLSHMESVHRPNGNKWTDRDYRVERGDRPMSAESGPRRNIHPTVKPTELMRYLCRLVTPPGGTVLDPFMGSGSTGKAATIDGFDFIGFDLSAEYCSIAEARISHAKNTR